MVWLAIQTGRPDLAVQIGEFFSGLGTFLELSLVTRKVGLQSRTSTPALPRPGEERRPKVFNLSNGESKRRRRERKRRL